jgi:hypothetical protein
LADPVVPVQILQLLAQEFFELAEAAAADHLPAAVVVPAQAAAAVEALLDPVEMEQ